MSTDNQDETLVLTEQLLMAQMIQIDTISHLLIEKGIITEEKLYTKLKHVQQPYKTTKDS